MKNLFGNAEATHETFLKLQEKEATTRLSVAEVEHLKVVISEYHSSITHQEILWRQKSRLAWVRGSDSNSSFFHKLTPARRWESRISSTSLSDEENISDMGEIREAFRGIRR